MANDSLRSGEVSHTSLKAVVSSHLDSGAALFQEQFSFATFPIKFKYSYLEICKTYRKSFRGKFVGNNIRIKNVYY